MKLNKASLAELQYLARQTQYRYLALIELDRRIHDGSKNKYY